jgi:predicted transcriptional regulator
MRAHDLAAPFPTVTLGTSALEAARLLAANDLPGLIVVDGRGHPTTVLAGTQVLRMAIPRYCIDDPTLARVVDEEHADTFMADLADRTVAELLPERPGELPVVDPDATVLEIAALMARARSPLVAVVGDGEMQGAITLDALLDRMLGT